MMFYRYCKSKVIFQWLMLFIGSGVAVTIFFHGFFKTTVVYEAVPIKIIDSLNMDKQLPHPWNDQLDENRSSFGYTLLGCYKLYQNPTNTQYAATMHECIKICQNNQSILSLYSEDNLCGCEDYFISAAGVNNCNKIKDEDDHRFMWISSADTASKITVERTLYGSCSCKDTVCSSLTCKTDELRWVGPSFQSLLDQLSRSKICRRNEPKICRVTESEVNAKCLVCINGSERFWPYVKTLTHLVLQTMNNSYILQSNQNEIHVDTTRRSDQSRVVISGYYRSGSTITAQIFSDPSDHFFVFEPLVAVGSEKLFPTEDHIRFLPNSSTHRQILQTITNVMKCDLYNISFNIFTQEENSITLPQECYSSNYLECISILINECKSRSILSTKLIRTKISTLHHLIKTTLPDLKIVALFRDPRAIYASWKMYFLSSHTAVHSSYLKYVISDLCRQQEEDFKEMIKMDARYKKQVYLLYYEDLVSEPEKTITNIYKSLNMGVVPHKIIDHITTLLNGSNKDVNELYYGLERKESGRTIAYKWKAQLSYEEVMMLNEICSSSFKYTGYEPVTEETLLRNMSLRHFTRTSVFQDLLSH